MRGAPLVAFGACLVACVALIARPSGLSANAAAGLAGNVMNGRVVDRASGQPVPEAIVTLAGGNPVQRVVASAQGTFAFRGIADGAYVVRADRPGYLSASAGQRTPTGGGEPIALSAGQSTPDVVISLWRAGSISGTVAGAGDAMMPGVEVHALQRVVAGGAWQWSDVASGSSDDHGRYHLANLGPGEFLLVGRPVQDPETALLMALFTANTVSAADVMANVEATAGETPTLDARVLATSLASMSAATGTRPALLTLAAGATRTDVVLRVKQAHGVRVSGILAGASVPTRGLTVRLVAPIVAPGSDPSEDQAIEVASAACDDRGRFEFSNVLPGRYRLTVSWMPPVAAAPEGRPGGPLPVLPLPTDPAISADQPLVVTSTNVSGVRLDAHEGFHIAGRTVGAVDASTIIPGLQLTNLRLDIVGTPVIPATTPMPSRFRIDASGRLTSSSIAAGRYLLRVVPPRGWTVVSATSRGHDLLDDPIDLRANIDDLTLTLTSGPLGAVTGLVVTAAGEPSNGATALIFPADVADRGDTSPTARRMRQIRVPAWGAFTFGNLPPGNYLAVALASDPAADWQSPESLRALARSAKPVTVTLAQTQTIRLEVSK